MKKKDLLKLIEAKQTILKNEKLVDFAKNISEDKLFSGINVLEKEFNILKKELISAREETKQAQDIINSFDCNHDVRLNKFWLFGSTSYCIFCDKGITSDNNCNWEYSKSRNKYCVILDDRDQDDNDGYYIIEDGYTITKVFEIILEIIKDKDDEDEIDLIQEFKKLNLERCTVNDENKIKENYILILSGSNKQYIDRETFIHKKGLETGLDFVDYFYGLLNTKVELIDNAEFLENKDIQKKISSYNKNVKFTSYDTIENLEWTLKHQKDVPFKIIIDLSELYNYKAENNSIEKESIDINLNEIFPNSKIIKIGNFYKKSLEELSNFLKSNNNVYGYQDKKYHYLENNEIKTETIENTCEKVKRLLKN